jgi:hypothetical protein
MRLRSRKRYDIDTGAHRRHLYIAGVVLLVMAVGAGIWWYVSKIQPQQATPRVVEESVIDDPVTNQIEGKYLFSGTIVMARAVEKVAAGDYNQPFSKFDTFNPSQYDGWLADLECPATNKIVSYQEQVTNLVFNCHPNWFLALSKYFTMFNLANNHTGDMGAAGFTETQTNLDAAGFQTVGSVDPANTEDACEVMALSVRLLKSNSKTEKGTLPIAFCSFHYFFRMPKDGEMDIVKEYAKYMPVFGLMHVGVEYRPNSDANQQLVAHTLIDNGASFVIGNSPHWVQESEVYRGKPIFYSTGNFIFDQLEYEEQRGVSIAVDMKLNADSNVEMWLALGEQCKKRRDNCLEMAKDQNLQKVPVTLKYQPIGSSGGNRKLTQLADAKLQASIEERLRWSATKAALGQ